MQYFQTQDHTTTGQTNKVVVLNFDDFFFTQSAACRNIEMAKTVSSRIT